MYQVFVLVFVRSSALLFKQSCCGSPSACLLTRDHPYCHHVRLSTTKTPLNTPLFAGQGLSLCCAPPHAGLHCHSG